MIILHVWLTYLEPPKISTLKHDRDDVCCDLSTRETPKLNGQPFQRNKIHIFNFSMLTVKTWTSHFLTLASVSTPSNLRLNAFTTERKSGEYQSRFIYPATGRQSLVVITLENQRCFWICWATIFRSREEFFCMPTPMFWGWANKETFKVWLQVWFLVCVIFGSFEEEM
jgi:hypothetical protein